MKFDTLCSIVLEGKKAQQFARIMVGNESPVFSIDDVLRDPADPSKGTKSHIDEKGEADETDPERQARRALRRLNWVAKTAIRRIGRREIDIRKLHTAIIMVIEQYLTNVLRYSDDQLEGMKLKIAKEAAYIGNLLLPPTERYPKAKGVFVVAPSTLGTEGRPMKKELKGTGETAARISKEFNMTVDEFIAAFDPDLLGTIKEIIRTGAIKKPAKEVSEETPTEETPEEAEEIATESVDDPNDTGVTVDDIMKDPRIRNVYDARIVRKVLKSMMSLGTVITNAEGKLILPEPGTEAWRGKYDKWREEKDLEKIEDFPQDQEVKELGDTLDDKEPTAADLGEIEDEEEEKEEVNTDDKIAASRLGYTEPSKEPEAEEEEEEDESSEDGSWYK